MRPLLLCWALLLPLAGLLQPHSSALTLGVLRRDALIVPMAAYDGREWKNFWPTAGEGGDVPVNLRSVPANWWGPAGPRETWQVWTPAPSPQLVTVRQPDWAPTFCQKQIGLRTDYQPRVWPPKPDTSPFPKDGLAVSPPHAIEPIDVVSPGSNEADDVLEAIHTPFADREQVALTNLRPAHIYNPERFPETPDEGVLRATPSMAIEALYAYGATHRTYFVEAVREYRQKGACMATGFSTGWVHRDSGKFTVQPGPFVLDFCDRRNISYMLPLGVLPLPTGTFWIAQISSWYGEAYTVQDISADQKKTDPRPALITRGGTCLTN